MFTKPFSKESNYKLKDLENNIKSFNKISISVLTVLTILVGIKAQQNEMLNQILGSVKTEAGGGQLDWSMYGGQENFYGIYNTSLNNLGTPYNVDFSNVMYGGTHYPYGPSGLDSWANPITYQNRCMNAGGTNNLRVYGKMRHVNGFIPSLVMDQIAGPALTISNSNQTFTQASQPEIPNYFPGPNRIQQANYGVTVPNAVGQTIPTRVTGIYGKTNSAGGYLEQSDELFANFYVDVANTPPTPTTNTPTVTAIGSSVSVPVNFTVNDVQANATNNVIQLSNNNFGTILQTQNFNNIVAGSTINHTFTGLTPGNYQWRVTSNEISGPGTCANSYRNGVAAQPINFRLTPLGVRVGNPTTLNPSDITITGTNGSGTCSSVNTVYPIGSLTCAYIPINPNFVGMDTITTSIPSYSQTLFGSQVEARSYQRKIDFNPLPIPTNFLSGNTNGIITVTAPVLDSDLSLNKTLTSPGLVSGNNADYTLTVSNAGPSQSIGPITITDSLPNRLSYVSSAGTGWTCNAALQVVTCTNPNPLANGANSNVVITVKVD